MLLLHDLLLLAARFCDMMLYRECAGDEGGGSGMLMMVSSSGRALEYKRVGAVARGRNDVGNARTNKYEVVVRTVHSNIKSTAGGASLPLC